LTNGKARQETVAKVEAQADMEGCSMHRGQGGVIHAIFLRQVMLCCLASNHDVSTELNGSFLGCSLIEGYVEKWRRAV